MKEAKAEAIKEFHSYSIPMGVKTVGSLLNGIMAQAGLRSKLLFVADDGGIVI
jgi:hypothetical protein